jgi:uncharacterized protein DUF6879
VTRLDVAELGLHLGRFRRELFRMETLPAYAVSSDGDDYLRWLAGETEPTWERKNRWLATLRAERAAGKISRRVRVLSAQLTEYERYACEWGYALNAPAGEDIRILRRGEHGIPQDVITDRDFWIVDDSEVVAMHYDADGRFEGAEVLPSDTLERHRDTRDRTWEAAEPFVQWWARHPELHRSVAV